MRGFINFIREQGIIGLAVGFLLGGSASRVVSSLVNDVINPLVGLGLVRVGELKDLTIPIADAQVLIGNFLATVLDFVIIAAVVYFVIKGLKLDKIDRAKNKPEETIKKKQKK
ncbi:MAG: large conductance mechanosensitive channel [Patescibacteria group bacterium]|jgi:large conductance mechanosensitive channel|nr:large conductance mechanosensitive channel [Patescibacteria group bacterium]